MKNVLKWAGIVVGVLIVLVLVAVGAVYFISESKVNAKFDVKVEAIPVPTDADSIKRGEKIVATYGGCRDCHGENLGGQILIPAPVGPIYAPNITAGKGGIGTTFKDADYIRAIRHGVAPDGKGLLVMPVTDYVNFSADDLGAVIAYVKSVPPVDNVMPEPTLGPVGRILLVNGSFPPPSAAVIKHTDPLPVKPPVGATVAYGNYVANIGCKGCHGDGLSGGPIPGMPPEMPPALNLTPAGEMANWSEADFIKTFRAGVTPAGKTLRAPMPWKQIGQMSDDELRALYLYLKSVPPKAQGGR